MSWKECREKVDEFFDTYQIALARQLSTADWTHIVPEIQTISDKLIEDIPNAENEEESIGFAVFNNAGKRILHDGEKGRDFLRSAKRAALEPNGSTTKTGVSSD